MHLDSASGTAAYILISQSTLAQQGNGKTHKGGDSNRHQDDYCKYHQHNPFIKPFANFSVAVNRNRVVQRLFNMGHGES